MAMQGLTRYCGPHCLDGRGTERDYERHPDRAKGSRTHAIVASGIGLATARLSGRLLRLPRRSHDAPERDRAQLDAPELPARYREPGLSACALADVPSRRDRNDVGAVAGVPGCLPPGAN